MDAFAVIIFLIVFILGASIASTIKTMKIMKKKFWWFVFSIIIPYSLIFIFAIFYKNKSGGTWTEFEGPIFGIVLFVIYSAINILVQILKFKAITEKKKVEI